jgi:hypothetical protein
MRLHTFRLFYVTVKRCFGFNTAVRTSTMCEKNWRYQIRKANEQTTYRGIPHYLSYMEREYRGRQYIYS